MTCGKCNGRGELHMMYDKENEEVVRCSPAQVENRHRSDRWRFATREEVEQSRRHIGNNVHPACPDCGGDGLGKKDFR